MNWNKNCAQEIRQVKVPQLALPPTGPRPRLKSPNCRYTFKKEARVGQPPTRRILGAHLLSVISSAKNALKFFQTLFENLTDVEEILKSEFVAIFY